MPRDYAANSYFPSASFDTMQAGKKNPKLLNAVAAFEPFRQTAGDKGLADFIGDHPAWLGSTASAFIGNGYLAMNGVASNYASTPDSAALSITGNIDIRAKVNINWGSLSYDYGLAGDATGFTGYLFYLTTTGNINFLFGTGAATPFLSVAHGITSGTWWVRVTRVAATGVYAVYKSQDGINWTLISSATGTSGNIADSSALFQFGINTFNGNALIGNLYRVQIRNNILDDGTGIVLDADFSAQSVGTTSFIESSSNAATITVTSSAADTADPTFDGTRLTFDGTNDFGFITYDAALNPGNAMSALVGVKGASQLDKGVFGQWDTNAKRAWLIGSNTSNGALADIWVSADGGTTNAKRYTTSKTVFDNTDRTIGFTYDGANGRLKVFVDGVEDTAVTKATDGTVASIFAATSVNTTLGCYLATGATSAFFTGSITGAYLSLTPLTPANMLAFHEYLRQELAQSTTLANSGNTQGQTFPIEFFAACNNVAGTAGAFRITVGDFTAVSGGVSAIVVNYKGTGTGSGNKRIFDLQNNGATVFVLDKTGVVTAATFKPSVVAKTANATLLLTEDTIICDPTSGSFTLTLPPVSGTSGKRYLVKKEGATNNTVTLDANASETIDSALTFVVRGRQEVCEIVSNGTEWKRIIDSTGNVPVGTFLPWHKSFTNTPSLPNEFVECNGQTLSDTGSVYNGQVIPNLNGNGATQKYMLRGSTTSGTTAGSDTHTHTITFSTSSASVSGVGTTLVTGITSPTGSGSTLPAYFEVVWVMRIK